MAEFALPSRLDTSVPARQITTDTIVNLSGLIVTTNLVFMVALVE